MHQFITGARLPLQLIVEKIGLNHEERRSITSAYARLKPSGSPNFLQSNIHIMTNRPTWDFTRPREASIS
jgi:hypothetical protein